MSDRYWAFLSYSSADAAAAQRLHHKLEGYRIPRGLVGRPGRDGPVPRRLFPVFRDRDELPLASDLAEAIQSALQQSRHLIVLCSPAAAQSRWVNEEIRYFKSLGREDRVLAIILRGDPTAEPGTPEACFPTELGLRLGEDMPPDSPREPMAGDLRPGGDGSRHVLLKTVAGATGLRFDELVQRDRRRQRRRRLLIALPLLLLAAAGLWLWDHNRLKVTHFANVAMRWGVPEGIGELDDDALRRRNVHYRVESTQGRVRRVLRRNSAHLLLDHPTEGAAIHVVHYREDGQVQQVDLRDHNHHLVVRHVFGPRTTDAQGTVQVVEFKQDHEDAPKARSAAGLAGERSQGRRSDITAHRLRFDAQGRVVRRTYLNAYRVPRPNGHGSFGQALHYDGGLQWTRQESLGVDEKPHPEQSGLAAVVRTVDARGDLTQRRHLDAHGKPVWATIGYATIEIERDRWGNPVTSRYMGADDKPGLHRRIGVHLLRQEYDERGFQHAISCYGIDGEPVLRADRGNHRVVATYDARGNLVDEANFGLQGEPVLGTNGAHRLTLTYDDRGNVTEEAGFGVQGEPVFLKKGFHRLVQRFDANGHRIEIAYFGTDGTPTVFATLGAHRQTRTYDARGRLISVSYFGVDGAPTLDVRTGFHRRTQELDERGNRTREAYWGTDGQPVLSKRGYHRLDMPRNAYGHVTEERYFGIDGAAINSVDGHHRAVNRFDARGGQVSQSYFGVDGEPALDEPYGYHRLEKVWDERSNLIEESYFGKQGERVLHKQLGIHRFKSWYDERGRRTQQAFYGEDNAPTARNGIHRVALEHDDRGNLLSETYFGTDDQPANRDDLKVHRMTRRYGARSEPLEESYWDTSGQPTQGAAGFHRLARTFNARGQMVEVAFFDSDGSPLLRDDYGMHAVVRVVDARGRVTRLTYLDTERAPSTRKDWSVHRIDQAYDARGNLTSLAYFDTAGQPTPRSDTGFVREEYTYDDRDERTTAHGVRPDGRREVIPTKK